MFLSPIFILHCLFQMGKMALIGTVKPYCMGKTFQDRERFGSGMGPSEVKEFF